MKEGERFHTTQTHKEKHSLKNVVEEEIDHNVINNVTQGMVSIHMKQIPKQ